MNAIIDTILHKTRRHTSFLTKYIFIFLLGYNENMEITEITEIEMDIFLVLTFNGPFSWHKYVLLTSLLFSEVLRENGDRARSVLASDSCHNRVIDARKCFYEPGKLTSGLPRLILL